MDFLLTPTMEIITMIFTVIFLLLIVYYVAYTQNKKFKVHSNLSYMRAEWNDREYIDKRAAYKKRFKIIVMIAVIVVLLLIFPIMYFNPLYEVVLYIHSVLSA